MGNGVAGGLQDRLIQHLWDAALTAQWQPFLELLGEGLRGQCATLAEHDYASGSGQILAAYGVDAAMQARYDAHFSRINVWFAPQANLPAGSVVRSEQLLPLAELQRSEYFADWLRPQGLQHALGSTVIRDDTMVVKLGVLRGRRSGAMSDEELQAVRSLMPHLDKALRVSQRLRSSELGNLYVDQAFEANRLGLLLVDKDLGIHKLNRAAEGIFDAHDGLSIDVRRRLRVLDTAVARSLDAWIEAVMAQGASALGHRRLSVPRPSGRPGFIVQMAPAPQSPEALSRGGRRGALVLLVVADPARATFDDESTALDVLRWQFGISQSEARLALRLADGHTLAQAALSLGITEGTARVMSKHLFRKCGVHRQTDLVRLILNSRLS